MDDDHFEALVSRMERLQQRSPSAYKARVLALAALGYAYLVAIVILLIGLTVAALLLMRASAVAGGKLALIIVPLLWIVVKSLWVRLEPPAGEPLSRKEAPELFRILDQLRARLKTPRLHAVLVTPDFNAGVTQLPRLGVFGWHRNYLLAGLPLMKSLTVPQFKSVLAHELGHLSRGHARTGNWIYRLRLVWQRLEAALEAHGGPGSVLIRRFFRWYIPYFVACSFPFARSNEYEADASAVHLTSARATGQALTNVTVMSSYLNERFWPGIHEAAKHSAQPAFAPYRELTAATLQRVEPGDTQRWLMQALSERTGHSDTHPSLSDRLAAIGVGPELVLPGPGEGADQLLGAHGLLLESALDAQWRARVAEAWQQIFEQSQRDRERLAELQACAGVQPLDAETTLELAHLEEQVGSGPAIALALRREALAREPGFVPARFALGRQLLEQGDSEGVPLMEVAIEEAPAAILPGSELLRDYWSRIGDQDRARQWHRRFVERARMLYVDQHERSQLRLSDSWQPHELDAGSLENLRAQLKTIEGLRRVYLVRKATTHFAERPLYAAGFKVGLLRFYSTPRVQRVKEQLAAEVEWPGETLILHVEGANRLFARKFRRIRAARILG